MPTHDQTRRGARAAGPARDTQSHTERSPKAQTPGSEFTIDAARAAAIKPRYRVTQAEHAAIQVMYAAESLRSALEEGQKGDEIKDLAPVSKISMAGLTLLETADIIWQVVSPVLTVVTGGAAAFVTEPLRQTGKVLGLTAVKKTGASVAREQIAGKPIQQAGSETGDWASKVKALTPLPNIERLKSYWHERQTRFVDEDVLEKLLEARRLYTSVKARLSQLSRSREISKLLDRKHRYYLFDARFVLAQADVWLARYEERSRKALGDDRPRNRPPQKGSGRGRAEGWKEISVHPVEPLPPGFVPD